MEQALAAQNGGFRAYSAKGKQAAPRTRGDRGLSQWQNPAGIWRDGRDCHGAHGVSVVPQRSLPNLDKLIELGYLQRLANTH